MQLQARVFVRTALIYLVAGLVVGGLDLIGEAALPNARVGALRPVFYHMIAVGWLTQLIAGVALWMFPPLSRERPRGDERVGWVAYGALNAGLLLRIVGEPMQAWAGRGAELLIVAAILQAVAAWALVAALWPRVKGRERPAPR